MNRHRCSPHRNNRQARPHFPASSPTRNNFATWHSSSLTELKQNPAGGNASRIELACPQGGYLTKSQLIPISANSSFRWLLSSLFLRLDDFLGQLEHGSHVGKLLARNV